MGPWDDDRRGHKRERKYSSDEDDGRFQAPKAQRRNDQNRSDARIARFQSRNEDRHHHSRNEDRYHHSRNEDRYRHSRNEGRIDERRSGDAYHRGDSHRSRADGDQSWRGQDHRDQYPSGREPEARDGGRYGGEGSRNRTHNDRDGGYRNEGGMGDRGYAGGGRSYNNERQNQRGASGYGFEPGRGESRNPQRQERGDGEWLGGPPEGLGDTGDFEKSTETWEGIGDLDSPPEPQPDWDDARNLAKTLAKNMDSDVAGEDKRQQGDTAREAQGNTSNRTVAGDGDFEQKLQRLKKDALAAIRTTSRAGNVSKSRGNAPIPTSQAASETPSNTLSGSKPAGA